MSLMAVILITLVLVSILILYIAVNAKTKRMTKRKAIISIIALMILLLFVIIYGVILIANTNMYLNMTSIISSTGILDDEEEEEKRRTRGRQYNNKDGEEIVTRFGLYPIDDTLRIRQEMLEICEKIGEAYGVDGKTVLAIALAEAHSSMTSLPNIEQVNGKVGSLYVNLSIDNVVGSNGRNFFIASGNEGKYKDKNGKAITDKYKVGKIDTSVGGAIGLYQFEASYIEGNFVTMYREINGKVVPEVGVKIMSYFDEQLGFMRPNPLYFPDQAINAINKIKWHMDDHAGQLNDIKVSLPDKVKEEILFIYAADAYRGDMTGSGKNGKNMHDAMGNLYADVYSKYSKQEPNIKYLGQFSSESYDKSSIRKLATGRQYNSTEFSGRMDGSPVTVAGTTFNKTFLEEFSNTPPHNINYLSYFDQVNNGGRNQNRLGIAHGFEALNASEYYWNLWEKQIEAAEKVETGGGSSGGLVVGEGEFLHPTPKYRNIASPYGPRIHPTKKVSSFHTGVDFAAPSGADILASKSGVVLQAAWNNAYGYKTVINHNDGTTTMYGHQSKMLVKAGDEVRAGDIIGYVGSTGWSTGPHLHFEIRIDNKHVNPMAYLKR